MPHLLSFMAFLGRAAIDLRYIYSNPEILPQDVGTSAAVVTFYMIFFGAWAWALSAAGQTKRTGLIILLIVNLLAVLLTASTTLFICPTPCQTAWPLAEIINLSSLVLALAALASVLTTLRRPAAAEAQHQ
jgi:hypothetical protein